MIHATLYPSARDTTPASRDDFESWAEFREALADLVAVEAPSKDTCPYWSPVELREGTTRADANVERATLAVIDVDALPLGLDSLMGALRETGLEAVVYESPSSTDDAPRVRVVAPVTRPMAPAEVAHVRLALAEALDLAPGSGVDGALPASLGFYAGRVAGTRPRNVWHVAGEPVDVDAALAAPLVHAWGRRASEPREPKQRDARHAEPRETERVRELASRIEARWLAGGRETDNLERALYGWLRGCGWSRGEVVALVAALDANEPSRRKRAEHARKAREATPLAGPSSAVRAWLDEDFAAVDELASRARREWGERFLARRKAPTAPTAGVSLLGEIYALGDEPPPIDYLCRGLCLATSDGKISVIAGEPGGGKGPLADYLAVCFATGAKAFGVHECTRARVLLIDVEGVHLTLRRVHRMARAMGIDPRSTSDTLRIMKGSRIDFASDATHAELARYVHENEIRVVVLDSYTSAMLNSGVEMNQPEFASLAKTLGGLGVLVVAVAHANKDAARNGGEPRLVDVAYSGAFAAMAQTAIVVHYPNRDERNVVRVGCARAPEEGFASFEVEWRDTDDGALAVAIHVPEKKETAAERVTREREEKRAAREAAAVAERERREDLAVFHVAREGFFQHKRLADRMGVSRNTSFTAMIDELIADGWIDERAGALYAPDAAPRARALGGFTDSRHARLALAWQRGIDARSDNTRVLTRSDHHRAASSPTLETDEHS